MIRNQSFNQGAQRKDASCESNNHAARIFVIATHVQAVHAIRGAPPPLLDISVEGNTPLIYIVSYAIELSFLQLRWRGPVF